ncbi:hypothetical protein DFP93_10925 [Aneurinibacillus soli]|uniref:Uncharacterized protein n=1 Tax=Aneurinibacillus soli TaxID=1500254 RepID=A0A0U5AVT7_9BACL|nr:hypothetical protein [Aneurinibacillus soli]PYE61326.1 hypothetical protein DFP93_10925 [Aneurinibacillus soli]BAU27845.1 hypothetical protein CB4_02019 [Aneurinibacillus soli]
MVVPIIFGVLAVVVLILVIFFNTRALSEPSKNTVDEMKQQETVMIKDGKVMEEEKGDPADMMDQDYRDALRQFQTTGKKSSQATSNKESTTERMQDEEYRNALRAMTNSKPSNRSDDRKNGR